MTEHHHKHHRSLPTTLGYSSLAMLISYVQTWMIYSATTTSETTQIIPNSTSFFLGETWGNTLLGIFFVNQCVHIYDHITDGHDHGDSHSHQNQPGSSKEQSYGTLPNPHGGDTENLKQISMASPTESLSTSSCIFNWVFLTAGIGLATTSDYYQFKSLDSTWKTGLFLTCAVANNIFVDGRHLYEWLLNNPIEFMQRTTESSDDTSPMSKQNLIKIFIFQLVIHITSALLLADRVTLPWLMYTCALFKAILEALEHTDDYITLNDIKKHYNLLHSTSCTQSCRKLATISLATLSGVGCATPHMYYISYIVQKNQTKDNNIDWELMILITFTAGCALVEFINGFVNFLNRLGSHIAGTRTNAHSTTDDDSSVTTELTPINERLIKDIESLLSNGSKSNTDADNLPHHQPS